MVDLDKLWSYFGLKILKTDQVSPVSIFCGPVVGRKGRVRTHIKAPKTVTARAKTTTTTTAPAAAVVIE